MAEASVQNQRFLQLFWELGSLDVKRAPARPSRPHWTSIAPLLTKFI